MCLVFSVYLGLGLRLILGLGFSLTPSVQRQTSIEISFRICG